MTTKQTRVAIAASIVLVLIIGSAWIIKSGRPVEQLRETESKMNTQSTPATTPTTTTTPTTSTETAGTTASGFSLADVQKHATTADCWSAVNGDVYDLTTWISRHPGGPKPIEFMCGKNASEAFNKKHGENSGAKQALILLKIGALK